MAGRRFSLVFILLISACATANGSRHITVQSDLAECATIENKKILKKGAFPVLSYDLKVHKSIAECGCKSALGVYSVYYLGDGFKSHIMSGKVGFLDSSPKEVPLSAEERLISNRDLIVEFSCALPD